MHSKIFQISTKPIDKDDYKSPDEYYENSGDFADYICDEVAEEDRQVYIDALAENLKGVFTPVAPGVFAYNGEQAMREFKKLWAAEILDKAMDLTVDGFFSSHLLYQIRETTDCTHTGTSFRVDIDGWTGDIAYPFGELIKYADCRLKEGDRIYVGAIIDYHF